MPVISRRDVLCASSAALMMPVTSTLVEGIAFEPAVSSSANGINIDLQTYVVTNVPRTIAKLRKGALDSGDLQELAGRTRLLACHIGTLDTEKFRRTLVSSLDTSKERDLSQSTEADQAYTEITTYASDLTRNEFQRVLTFSPNDLEAGRQSLAAHRLDWHFHSAAEKITTIGHMELLRSTEKASFSRTALTMATPAAHIVSLEGTNAKRYKLRNIDLSVCGGHVITTQQVCQLITGLIALGSTLAGLLAGVTPPPAALAALAAALGLSLSSLAIFLFGIAAIAAYYVIWC